MSFRLLLFCLGWIYMCMSVTEFNLGSVILTQNGFTDAPDRYSEWINEAINELNAMLPTNPVYDWCSDSKCCEHESITVTSWHFSINIDRDIQIQITDKGVQIHTFINYNAAGEYYYRYGWQYDVFGDKGCIVWLDCEWHDYSATGTATVITDINIDWDGKDITLLVAPVNVQVTVYLESVSGWCASYLAAWEGFIGSSINEWVTKKCQNSINDQLANMQQKINSPPTIELYPGIFLDYVYTGVIIVANSHIYGTMKGSIKVQLYDGTWVTYETDSEDANIEIPNIWPSTNDKTIEDGHTMYFLDGLRISSTVLEAIVWGLNERGQLTPTYNFTVLDSTLLFYFEWDYPKIGIPSNDTLSVDIGYAFANGTCYPTNTPNDTHLVLQFYVENLNGAGTVSLIYLNDSVQLAIQIDYIDASHLNPVLVYPQLLLPADFVQDLAVQLINGSIEIINAFFTANAITIPGNMSRWIPHPQLTLVHQDGCCNNTHGYMQFYSMCSCIQEYDQWGPCNHLACPTPTPTQSQTTQSQTIQDVLSKPSNSTFRTNVKSDYSDFDDNSGIWWYSFSSESHTCSIKNETDSLTVMHLYNTNNACTVMPIPQGYFNQTLFYSLDMSNNGLNDINILCNNECQNCAYSGTNIDYGYCILSNTQMYMFLEYNNDSICIGGVDQVSNEDVIASAYQQNAPINCGPTSTIIGVNNVGNITNQCNNNNGSFYTLTQHNNSNEYTLDLNCDSSCQTCQMKQDVTFGECNVEKIPFHDISLGVKAQFGSDISVCGSVSPTPDNNKKSKKPFPVKIIWYIIAGIAVVVTVFGCIRYRKECGLNTLNCYLYSVRMLSKGLRCCWNYIKDSFNSPCKRYTEMTTKEFIHNIFMILATISAFLSYIMWSIQSPWSIFTEEGFAKIGVPQGTLDITNLNDVLHLWEQGCQLFFFISGIVFSLMFILPFICARKICCMEWKTIRVVLLLLYVNLTFLIGFLCVPTFYQFSQSVKLNNNEINTFTSSEDIQNTVNSIIGIAFGGVFVTFFSNVVLYYVFSIPCGITIISLLFIQGLFRYEIDKNVFKKQNNHLFNYDVPIRRKSAIIGRIIVLLFVIQSMSSCIQSLPVVIMYQSFGSSNMWFISFVIAWVIPMIIIYHAWKVCCYYIRNIDDSKSIVFKCRLHIYIDIGIMCIVYIFVSIVSINCEATETLLSVAFTVVLCINSAIIGGIAWLYVLHYMFIDLEENDEADSGRLLKHHDNPDLDSPVENQFLDDHKEITDNDCCFWCPDVYQESKECSGCRYMLEADELKDPDTHGARVKYRRMFLLIGCIAFGYTSIKHFISVMGISTKQEVVNFINDNWDVVWPDDSEQAGQTFDPLFDEIDKVRYVSASFGIIALSCFIFGLFANCLCNNKRGLKVSKISLWIGLLILIGTIFAPAIPNYLSKTPLHKICPTCGSQFNQALDLLFGDIVGLICAGMFVFLMLPIVIGAVVPALVRSSHQVLHNKHNHRLSKTETDTINYVIITSAMLTPYITFVPLLVYQQFEGDYISGIMLMMFWVLPIFISFYVGKYCLCYGMYFFLYYWILIGIFIYHTIEFGLPDWLRQILESPQLIMDLIIEIIGEVALTIVLLSDFIYSIILGLRYVKKDKIIIRNDDKSDFYGLQ